MSRQHHRIGILFSATGIYGSMAAAMRNGAVLAVAEVNAAQTDLELEPIAADPACILSRYPTLAGELLDAGVRQVVGCYTSASRKEVIPLIEKRDALLWYPAHYEGFESSPNVVYTGAAPNQHIVPLIAWALPHVGRRAYCVGSNYVWAWETNRVVREAILAAGGRITNERYVALGDLDFGQIIAEIVADRPAFILNTLIGASACAFLHDLRDACACIGLHQPTTFPVLCCNLSEATLAALAPEDRDGHISSSVYFSSVPRPQSRSFVTSYHARFAVLPSADAEAAYVAVHLLARALRAAGTDTVDAVKQAVAQQRLQAPQGDVWIDAGTMHAFLTPRIGRSRTDGSFDILQAAAAPIAPDPYLVRSTPRYEAPASHLRVVS